MRIGAAYVRVSTTDQIEFSPDSQIKKIREYAANHEILLPDQYIFLDEGISGKNAEKRPAFMNMIGLSKQKPKPFDVILLWKFSRFARNRQDSILYKSMLRKECGIEVTSITEQLSQDPTAILIEALLEAMDEYYSINLAQEVRRGMNEKFSRGGVVSIPPFGYKMGKEKFEIDEEKALLVRMIYENFLDGESYRQIASKLNKMGIRSNRGNLFESRTIEYILSNPTYLGKLRRNLNGTDDTDRFHRGEKMTVVDAEHEAIISEKTFCLAQKRIEEVKKTHKNYAHTHFAHNDFMLRGLVRCSSCDSTLTRSEKGRALQCHKYTKGQCRDSHYVRLELLNRIVLEKIEEDLKEEAGTQKKELKICVCGRKNVTTAKISEILLEKELQKLERIKAAYEAGIDTLEEYSRKKADTEKQIKELQKESRKFDAESTEGSSKETTAVCQIHWENVIQMLRSSQISETEKNEILRSFVYKIVFDRENETIQIYYYL